MELIVIAKPKSFNGETQIVNQLFEAGLQVFHLRKEINERSTYQKFLAGILPEYHHRIALHHFHELAGDYGIKRIHHTENCRKRNAGMDFSGNRIFSTSIHRVEDIPYIGQYHYSFLSPIFDSISKPGYMGIITPKFMLKKTHHTKLIALGGIGLNEVALVKDMDFDGLALLGSIWKEPAQALTNFKQIQSKCEFIT
ncbi:thiamine phosphate synthase [Pedobacter sp. GSP4]|uniref:thiamine phosphate synthase n=1 Tax=Pedobacter sp. GSP4 TaxID=3453716 RepID=UPI003EEBECC8